MTKIRNSLLVCLILLIFLFCTGCEKKEAGTASDTRAFFDTSVTLTIYGPAADQALSECFDMCRSMELIYSAENEKSELSKINHRSAQTVEISDDLRNAISLGLQAYEDSGGLFDITMLPVTRLWDFRSGKGKVPDAYLLSEELLRVNAETLSLDGNSLSISDRNVELDLGAIAKGCISASLKEYLQSREGVTGAVLNLGGNISVVGGKPDGQPFRIGIQKPFSNRGETLATVELPGGYCVISSGVYERCFEQDGHFYHHILSSETGYPVETAITQATVIGTDDALCDTLSTVCILLGKEKAEALIAEKYPDLTVLFTDADNQLLRYDAQSGEAAVNLSEPIIIK